MRAGPLGLAAAMACTVLSQPLRAADLPLSPEQPIQIVPSWTGFYFGGQIGGIVDGDDRTVSSGDGGPVASPQFGGRGGRTGIAVGEIGDRDFLAGLHAGYNWQQGNFVFGVEADVNSLGPIEDVLGSVRGRLGFGNDRALFYGTAGLGYVSLSGGAEGVFVGGDGGAGGNGGPRGEGGTGGNGFGTLTVGRDSTDEIGFVGGVGAEVRLSRRVGVGAQALYHSFDLGDGNFVIPEDFVTVSGRLTFHMNEAESAFAADASTTSSWAGLYVGGHLGVLYTLSDGVIDDVDLADGEPGTPGVRGIDGGGGGGGAVAFAELGRNGALIGGGHIGYNWQSGNIVFGAEADVDASTEDSSTVLGSVRGRLGFATQDYLFYGTAGFAVVRDESVRAIFAEDGGPGGNGGAVVAGPGGAGGAGGRALALGSEDIRAGFVVGPGFEAKVSSRVTVGLEGLYYGFEDRDAPSLPSGSGRSFTSDDEGDAFVFRTRVSYALQP